MRVIIDTEKINKFIYELLRNKYNFMIDDAADISDDIEELIINNKND